MCGISGKLNFADPRPVEPGLMKKMCDLIAYRGPDDEGYYADGSIGLGMRRLSIIDVAGSHQPIHNEDQSVWVVCSGEIYNFLELREQLEKKGHRFYTKSDTETIAISMKIMAMVALSIYEGCLPWPSGTARSRD